MAVVLRTYRFDMVFDANLDKFVGNSSFVSSRSAGLPTITISIDDAAPGATDTLDQYMLIKGFVYVP